MSKSKVRVKGKKSLCHGCGHMHKQSKDKKSWSCMKNDTLAKQGIKGEELDRQFCHCTKLTK